MEDIQTVTLSIPKDLMRKAVILAARKNTSLSGLLVQALADLVKRQDEYEQAMRRSLETLRSGFDLGTGGKIRWKRDDLHER